MFCQVLQPFAVATDLLQGDKTVTSSHLVPTVMGLRCALTAAPVPTTASVRALRAALLESLNRRFGDVERDATFLTATVLDPRFKLLPWAARAADAKEVSIK